MNDYIRDNLPETFEALSVMWATVLDAAGEVSKAEAAKKRAEQAWSDAKAKSNAEACAHFAANNPPIGVVVPADLLARVVKAINTPALGWDSHARRFRERTAAGAAATVAPAHRDGRVVLLVRLYQVETYHAAPSWACVAALEVWAHSGTIAGTGGRKRVVSEEDVAALVALGVQS